MYDAPVKVQTLEDIDKEPLRLPQSFCWAVINLNDEKHAKELYDLLTKHYVEDQFGKFRFDY